ncbi:hypothetical protein ACFGVR_22135 [Mucilaginibacter sp. AW1-3]
MFKPKVIKVAAYVAMVCSFLGIILSLLELKVFGTWNFYLVALTWIFLMYSSYLGIKLSTYADLYDEDRRKLGLYIFCILALFILFLFVSLAVSVLPALFLAITLHNQKKGLDSWAAEQKNAEADI